MSGAVSGNEMKQGRAVAKREKERKGAGRGKGESGEAGGGH